MITALSTAAQVYGVRDAAALAAKHEAFLAQQRANGLSIEASVDRTQQFARVDHGRWLFDCVCGSGVAAHPDWPEARCFGCGAIYPAVVYPADRDRQAIEVALVKRKALANRNWRPGETVDDLRAENLDHGVEVVS